MIRTHKSLYSRFSNIEHHDPIRWAREEILLSRLTEMRRCYLVGPAAKQLRRDLGLSPSAFEALIEGLRANREVMIGFDRGGVYFEILPGLDAWDEEVED